MSKRIKVLRTAAILRLLIEGRADREIAEALFINPRTVSGPVTNLLAKLGVESPTAATSPPEAEVLGLTPITLLKEARDDGVLGARSKTTVIPSGARRRSRGISLRVRARALYGRRSATAGFSRVIRVSAGTSAPRERGQPPLGRSACGIRWSTWEATLPNVGGGVLRTGWHRA